jgi:hypothetical protein
MPELVEVCLEHVSVDGLRRYFVVSVEAPGLVAGGRKWFSPLMSEAEVRTALNRRGLSDARVDRLLIESRERPIGEPTCESVAS